jgi:hypothetical protein
LPARFPPSLSRPNFFRHLGRIAELTRLLTGREPGH